MITTALLVRWQDGWHEVNNPAGVAAWGRKEATLALGAATNVTEVDTVAAQQLGIFVDPRTEIAGDVYPRGDSDTPFVAYNTADRLVVGDTPGRPPANQQIQAITAVADDDGHVTYAVELRDVLLTGRERFAETVAKMANGTLGGDSKVAQPTSSFAPVADCCAPPLPPALVMTAFVVSTSSDVPSLTGNGHSDVLTSAPYGTSYTLDTFAITVPASHHSDGLPTRLQLWLDEAGEDTSLLYAEIDLGTDHEAGTYYASAYPAGMNMTIDGHWGLYIAGYTQAEGFRAFATFTNLGAEIVLDWADSY